MRATYYECPPQTGLVVPAGMPKVFAIPFPTRMRLTNLRVLQMAGTPAAFTVNLYNREVPDSPSPNNADEFWEVTPAGGISSTNNGVLCADFSGTDNFFDNKDDPVYTTGPGSTPTPSLVSIISAKRVIYARITCAGGGTFTFMLGGHHQSC
jgi:hypothetical protein